MGTRGEDGARRPYTSRSRARRSSKGLLGHGLQVGIAALGHSQDALQGQGAPELGADLEKTSGSSTTDWTSAARGTCVGIWGRGNAPVRIKPSRGPWAEATLRASWSFGTMDWTVY